MSDSEDKPRRSFGAYIPAPVRYNPKLSPGAKLLFGEIESLCNQKGFCWASNKYLASLYNVSERAIQHQLEALAREKFIKLKLTSANKGTRREIYITGHAMDPSFTLQESQNSTLDLQKIGVKKSSPRGEKNFTPGVTKFSPQILNNNYNSLSEAKALQKERSRFPKEEKKAKKKCKYPGDSIFNEAKEKWPDVITDSILKKHRAEFIEYYTEGNGSLATHVNWPLTFKNWVKRAITWGPLPEYKEVTQRVVADQFGSKDCGYCVQAKLKNSTCPIHKT